MSPRRSSRARTTQHTPSGPQHSNSSSSSMTSGRASRSTGPDQRPSSQRSSAAAAAAAAGSQSSEEPAKAQASRTRRGQDEVKKEVPHALDDDMDDDSEEEVTRCICGNQEYPGLPVSNSESSKISPRGDSNTAAFTEDATGWFIQCDGCKVWQHGGCVGIMDEATSPEEYFCEQCRKDLHKVTATTNGRKYSLYLPAQETKSPQSSPASATKKHSKRSKNGKVDLSNDESVLKGRRSTFNSRDAGYGEEQLRLAIEQSKREGGSSSAVLERGKGKRGRSESVERKEDTKRQRTGPGSASSSASQSRICRRGSNPEEEINKPERAKPVRGAAARNQANKEARDHEVQRGKERVDLGRRKGRVDKENGNEAHTDFNRRNKLNLPDSRSATPEPLRHTTSGKGNKPPTVSNPIPVLQDHQAPKPSHKKTGRPPARKGRVGRNQYTKDRDLPTHNDSKHKSSPAPSNSSQTADGGTPRGNGSTTGHGDTLGVGKPSRPRHMNPKRTTMNDMKRRVAGILDYISRTQVDMAGSVTALTTSSNTSSNTPPDSNNRSRPRNDAGNENSHGGVGKAGTLALLDPEGIDEQAFATLTSVEMMEVLTKRLMKWQGEYGKWGDK